MIVPDMAADWGLLVLRIGVGTSFLLHGIEKRMYWHQKPDRGGTQAMLRLYSFLTFAEPLGAIALFTGFLARLAALGTALIMLGAIRTRIVVWHNGWGDDDGWEIDGVILSASIALMLIGPGRFALDHLWAITL